MSLVVLPRQLVVDASGDVRSGAKLYVYDANSTTPRIAYQDSSLSVEHTIPVESIASGLFPAIYVDPVRGNYKLVLKDSDDVTIWTEDDVPVAETGDPTSAEDTAGVTPSNTLYPEGDLRRYGAVGDGVEDDTGALEDAISVGCDVIVPRGYTFYVPSVLQFTIDTDLCIRGGGILKGTSSLYLLKPAGGDIVLDGVTFDTWLGIVESDVADSGTTDLLKVQNNQFLNISGLTIDHERPVNNAIIDGNLFSAVTGEVVRIGKDDYSLQDTWKKVSITNNRWINIDSTGANSAIAAIVYGAEVDITGNYVYDVNAAGTGEAHGFYWKARKATITRNKVILVVSATGAAAKQTGLNGKGNARGSTSAPQGYNTIVSHNYVELVGGYGIRTQCDEALISFNIVEEPGDSAFTLDAAGDNIVVVGNKGYVLTGTSKVGIRVSVNGNRVNLADNLMEGFADTILVSVGAAETLSNLSIDGGILAAEASAGFGVRISLDAAGTLTNASIRNVKVSSASKGIGLPAAGTCTGLIVENNDLRAATTKINGTAPTDAVVRDNPGYSSGVAGADVAVNNVSDQSIASKTVAGLIAGDQILVDAFFTILNDSTATRVYTLTLDFDAAFDIEFATGALANSATLRHPFHMQAVLDIRSTSLAYCVVRCDGELAAGSASGADTTQQASNLQAMAWGTSAADLTGSTNATLVCRSANGTATQTLRLHSFLVRKISPS